MSYAYDVYYLGLFWMLGVMVTMIHTVNVASSKVDFSPVEVIVMILMPIVVAAILIWYTKYAVKKNWIN